MPIYEVKCRDAEEFERDCRIVLELLIPAETALAALSTTAQDKHIRISLEMSAKGVMAAQRLLNHVLNGTELNSYRDLTSWPL